MKLATYTASGRTRTGIVVGETIIDAGFDGTMMGLIARWEEARPALEARAAAGGGMPLASVRLEAPIARPGKIFAIGLNYRDHIAEMGMEPPAGQIWFTKAQTSINAPFDPVLLARGTSANDYEAEMVAVIGRRAKHVSAADAAACVFGYCAGNDMTERMAQQSSPQWSLAKSYDTHAPIGPWLTTADEIGDPHRLGIRCFVNGEQRQSSNTGNLVFSLWQQIEHLSRAMTLEPGDLIFTGTPGGVGAAAKPPRFVNAGDTVRVEIDELGAIEAVMKAE